MVDATNKAEDETITVRAPRLCKCSIYTDVGSEIVFSGSALNMRPKKPT